jgi:filamentous hemagglutinin family protein
MRSRILALACTAGLVVATAAGAETYSILEGAISDAATGGTSSLTGTFEATATFGAEPDLATRLVRVDDFELRAGDHSFPPRQPIEYDGWKPIPWLARTDQIWLVGDIVSGMYLRSGGELIAESEDEVTFRFLELRSDASSGSRVVGQLPDSALPRRFQLAGTLHEADQTFRLPNDDCMPVAQPLPGGGGVIIEAGGIDLVSGGAVVLFESFDLSQDQGAEFQPADGGSLRIRRVTGLERTILGGELQGDSVYFVDPGGVLLDGGGGASADPPDVPTLEELGITAPDGAEVTFDARGVLAIASEGSLIIVGPFPEIPGLTSLVITSGSSIEILGSISLPPDVSLEIDTAEIVGSPVIIDPFCNGLRPIRPPEEREIGTFSLVASAAQPVEIDVRPGRRHKRVDPASRRPILVALLGSEELDVRDVDESSLRLGPGEAQPLGHRGRLWVFRKDVNRDRRADLLALFDVRDAGIAPGDTAVCLMAETADGTEIEGCDAIETPPRWTRLNSPPRSVLIDRDWPSRSR